MDGRSSSKRTPAGDETRRLRVLVVDEVEATRERLEQLLRLDGWEVDLARTGLHLLDHLFSSHLHESGLPRPDVVLAVVRGRGVTLEALSGLVRRGWTVPLVVIRATDDAAVRRRLGGLGAAEVLDESVRPADLFAALRALAPEDTREQRPGRTEHP